MVLIRSRRTLESIHIYTPFDGSLSKGKTNVFELCKWYSIHIWILTERSFLSVYMVITDGIVFYSCHYYYTANFKNNKSQKLYFNLFANIFLFFGMSKQFANLLQNDFVFSELVLVYGSTQKINSSFIFRFYWTQNISNIFRTFDYITMCIIQK